MPEFDQYLERGQIEIISYDEWYLKDDTFNPQRVLNAWADRLNQALAKGYDGIRVAGDTAWLEKRDWKNFAQYEAEVNGVIDKYRMIAICTYPLDKCGAFEIIDVFRNHQFALIKCEDKWDLIENPERKRLSATAIIGAMCDGLVLLNMNRKITSVNPAFEKLSGYEKSELVGEDAADVAQKLIRSKGDLEKAMRGLGAALGGKVPSSGEFTLASRDGREIPITVSASVIKDTEGKSTTLILNVKDITELKKAEEERLNTEKQRREELEKFANIAVDRELKMAELKERIKELEKKLKEKP